MHWETKFWIKTTSVILGVIIILIIGWNLTAYRDVKQLKKEAPEYLESLGYKIIAVEGYTGDPIQGGMVYYVIKDTAGYIFQAGIASWMGELMIYNLKCLNAVESKK